jgi:hypothetical protein
MLNTIVLEAMPTATVSTIAAVYSGCRLNIRTAC